MLVKDEQRTFGPPSFASSADKRLLWAVKIKAGHDEKRNLQVTRMGQKPAKGGLK